MNILDTILNGSGAPLAQIGKKFGIGESLVAQATKQLLPALAKGIKKNTSQQGGLESLLGALKKGGHERYVDEGDSLNSEEAIADGNGILGHLLKSKDNSRELAQKTAQQTGLDVGIVKKMLPLVAGLAMGALKKESGASGLLTKGTGTDSLGSSLGSLITALDVDGDGSPVDNLLGFANKLF